MEDPEEMATPQGKIEKTNHNSSVHSEMWDNLTLRDMNTRNDDKADTWIADTAADQCTVTKRAWHA